MTSAPPSPSEQANQAERGLFSRWSRTWAALAALMLAIGLGFCWTDPKVDWPARLLAVGLAVVWGGWYGVFIIRVRRWKRDGWALTLSFVFAIEVATALAFIHPAFLMILFS